MLFSALRIMIDVPLVVGGTAKIGGVVNFSHIVLIVLEWMVDVHLSTYVFFFSLN